MKYFVIFCMALSGCTNNHKFMADTPKDGECWYIDEVGKSIGAKVYVVGKKQLLFKLIHDTVGVFGNFQLATVDLFTDVYPFKRDCPK